MEQENENTRLIFGLSPLAAFINGIVMCIFSGVFWAVSFLKQVPEGIKSINSKQIDELHIDIPWYYDIPFMVISLLLLFSWIEYKFKILPGELSWKAILYKYVYGVTFVMLLCFLTKVVIVYSFLN